MTVSREVLFPAPGLVEVVTRPVVAPGPGELLCRARISLVSTGTETFCLAGEFDAGTFWEEWVEFPFSPGYSMAAEVVAVGDGVVAFAPGDRVALSTPHAEYVTIAATEAIPIPDDVRDEQACWASLAVTTQLGVRRARLELGESVGVVGLGLLGQLVVRYLRLAGARRIVAIDTDSARLDLAVRGGATHRLHAPAGDARPEVLAATDGAGLDVVFDITGHPAAFAASSTLLRPLGRLILLGDSPRPSTQNLGPRIVADGISIIGVHASTAPATATHADAWTGAAMTALFFDYLRDGRMDIDELITHRRSPADAPALYAELVADRSRFLGVLFDWSELPS
jgi:2-desacetyl-2-hydroxyethyl bacteriochlorophyllide A dehydrogenase